MEQVTLDLHHPSTVTSPASTTVHVLLHPVKSVTSPAPKSAHVVSEPVKSVTSPAQKTNIHSGHRTPMINQGSPSSHVSSDGNDSPIHLTDVETDEVRYSCTVKGILQSCALAGCKCRSCEYDT